MALAAMALAAPVAGAAEDARFEGNSSDGSRAFFSTTDRVLPGDTDTRRDIIRALLRRGRGRLRHPPGLARAGRRQQRLRRPVPGERRAERRQGLLPHGRAPRRRRPRQRDRPVHARPGDEHDDAGLGRRPVLRRVPLRRSQPGRRRGPRRRRRRRREPRLLRQQRAALVPGQRQQRRHLRAQPEQGTTTLVSAGDPSCSGSCGAGTQPSFFLAASADGMRVTFTTHEKLAEGDEDGVDDIYQRDLSTAEGPSSYRRRASAR